MILKTLIENNETNKWKQTNWNFSPDKELQIVELYL